MERVGDDGERHSVDPAWLAQYDQMEARFNELTKKVLSLRDDIKDALAGGDTERVPVLTRELEELVKAELPEAKHTEINYVMYLVDLIEQAQTWTDHVFEAAEALVRMAGALAHPDHPLKTLPGFSSGKLSADLQSMLEALAHPQDAPEAQQGNFVTDSGVTIRQVHPAGECAGQFCVVHNPVPGPWDSWHTHWRNDWRLMVRICPHGVHHVAAEEMLRMPLLGMIAHEHPEGCDCACDLARCHPITDISGKIIGFEANTSEW